MVLWVNYIEQTQMNAIKYIVLSLLLIIPVFAAAQTRGKIQGNKYVVSTGDTTKIVNPTNAGLNSPDSKFLFNTSGRVIDSLYNEIQPNITPSKAVRDVNNILKEIERDQAIQSSGNSSLSYRLSTDYISAKNKEKSARAYADSLMLEQKKLSERELALNYLKYGNKPSYYVNGVQVNPEIASLLLPGDVLEQDRRAISPNPNGEVWLILTDKAIQRLGLSRVNTNSVYEQPLYNNVVKPENTQQRSEPVIRVDDDQKVSTPVQQNAGSQSQGKSRTIVRSRTINNEPVEVRRD